MLHAIFALFSPPHSKFGQDWKLPSEFRCSAAFFSTFKSIVGKREILGGGWKWREKPIQSAWVAHRNAFLPWVPIDKTAQSHRGRALDILLCSWLLQHYCSCFNPYQERVGGEKPNKSHFEAYASQQYLGNWSISISNIRGQKSHCRNAMLLLPLHLLRPGKTTCNAYLVIYKAFVQILHHACSFTRDQESYSYQP